MKKSKLSLGLVTSFVAALALAGCSDVKAKDNSILTFTGYDGAKYELATDAMYDQYRKDNSVISTFYDKVLEVLIRDYFEAHETIENASKGYDQIKAEAEVDVQAAKAKATENSKSNKTKYETEWDAILSSEGVEDEDELLQKYIYNKEKAVLEDALYATLTKASNDQLKKEWIEGTYDEENHRINVGARPYHIRHILAKVESGASDYTRGTITSDQAIRLSNIGLALGLSNDTFGGIAYRLSEDEGSGKLYGDVGITTTKASTSGTFSMVTEFQLAIYIYDALYSGRSTESQTFKDLIPDALPSNPTTPSAAFGGNDKITTVPYQVFQLLASEDNGGYGDVTKNNNKIVGQGEEVVYPRNILWNKYLNHHEPFLITDQEVADVYDGVKYSFSSSDENPDPDKITKKDVADLKTMLTNAAKASTSKEDHIGWDQFEVGASGASLAVNAKKAGATGFVACSELTEIPALATKLGAATKILVDENLNPIFGVRSEYGIHFIIIQKSAFESTESLMKWYQVYSPKQADYPTEGEDKTAITSYVNYAKFDDDQMTSRASAIKDAIKGFDGSYQYRIYEKLFTESASRFNLSEGEDGKKAKELLDSIENYITLQKEKNAYEQDVGYELAWDNFMLKFDQQTAERGKEQRVVPWAAAVGFKKGIDYTTVEDLYKIGGLCYYGDKAQ